MVSAESLAEAVDVYNEYRSPMATVAVLYRTEDAFTVRFEGPFCRMCCDYDYFEDLIYELEAVGEDVRSIEVADITDDGAETVVVAYTTRA